MRNAAGTLLGTQAWSPVKLGGLGFVTEIAHAADGTLMFCRTDVGGAYRRESTASAWTQIISAAHMTIPPPAATLGLGHDFGVFAIASAPSDPSVAYVTFRGRMMRSTNRGVDWADDSLNGSTGLYMGSNDTGGATNGFNVKNTSNKLVVDPTNPAVAYFGSQNNAGWRRLSGAWAQIASIPVAVGAGSGDRTIIFQVDNTSALTGSGATSRRSIVYCSVNGYGLYQSTDGGTTFSSIADASTFSAGTAISCTTNSTTTVTTASTSGLVAGMSVTGANIPAGTAIQSITNATTFVLSNAATSSTTLNLTFRAAYKSACIVCDQNGLLYLCFNNNTTSNVWKWNGSWTQITTPWFIAFLAVDPKDATRILGHGSGGMVKSTNSGTTWVGQWTPGENATVAVDCPMPAAVVQTGFSSGFSPAYAQIAPHPVDAKDYIAEGYGVFYIPSPWPAAHGTGANRLIWHEFCTGIETLVANRVVITPAGKTFLLGQDRGIILQNTSGYASNFFPSTALAMGFSTDWGCDDENYMAVLANGELGGQRSGYSTNGGLTWASFPVQPTVVSPTTYIAGGSIAVGNTGNVVCFPGGRGRPRVTHDNGATWTVPTFTGYTLPADGTDGGWGFGTITTRQSRACSDKLNPGTFYTFNYGYTGDGAGGANSKGIWKSTDGGDNWTRVNTTSVINPLFVGFHCNLLMDRGILYLCPGESGGSYDGDATNRTYRSEDGGVTWAALAQLYEINALAIGAPAPDSALHTLHALGWKTISGVATFGLFESLDKGATWTLLANNPWFDRAYALASDPRSTHFRRIIIGYTGTGFFEGNYSYNLLLKAA